MLFLARGLNRNLSQRSNYNYQKTMTERELLLRAFTGPQFVARSVGGLSRETRLPRQAVKSELNNLVAARLVSAFDWEDGKRFFLTSKGWQVARPLVERIEAAS